MKRLLFLATIALALFSCKDDKNVVIDSKESIEASPTSLSFAAQDAEAQVVQLTVSDGTKWKVSNKPAWITVNPGEGTGSANVTVTVYNSSSTSARSGKITFQNSSKSVTAVVEVSQDAYVAPEPIEGNVVPDPAPFDGTKRSNTTYQLLVYTFADSDGDKIGDFKGIQNKLDYLDELGVNALWLSPIHPSDSYHGYDITDYNAVNPVFGTETDLENLINAAHAKNIKIYLDYVLNHSGKGNPWFTEAISNPDSQYRNWYLISTNPSLDISNGRIPSVSSYNPDLWHARSYGEIGYSGRLHFALKVSGGKPQSITVTTSTATVQASNSDSTVKFWIYFGDNKLFRLYKTNDTLYEITLDFSSDWGFLVRTSDTAWGTDKWGASTGANIITFGTALNLNNSTAADITFGGGTVYYYGAFGSWMPDFNYGEYASAETSGAFKALAASVDKWIDLGIDGLRLDAVRFIYEKNSKTANPAFLRKWYNRCNTKFHAAGHTEDIYMVGEAWMESVSDMAPYYGGLPALFEFDYWFRLQWALNNSTGKYFVDDIMGYESLYQSYRSDYIEVPKLSNHDETRAGTTLGKNIAKMKQAAAFLLTSPGEPYIYQGEELGYWGDKSTGDENVRTPILWDKARTDCAKGHSGTNGVPRVDESMLTSSISVEAQLENEESILNVYRDFLRLRNTYPALAEGKWSKVNVAGDSIAAWYMTSGSQKLMVIHNVAASQKTVTLTDDLSHPVALLGNAEVSGNKLTLDGNSSVVFQL